MAKRNVGYWWLKKKAGDVKTVLPNAALKIERFTLHIPFFSKMRHLQVVIAQFEGDCTWWVESRGIVRCIGTRAECIAVIRAHSDKWMAEVPDRGN